MSLICRRPSQKGAARLVALMMAALVLWLPVDAHASHGTSPLDVELETGSGVAGTANDIVVKITPATTTNVVIDAEIIGPNDTDAEPGDSPLSPDKTCTIAGTAEAPADSCSLPFTPTVPAVNQPSVADTFRVWIDHDNSDTTAEADATEGIKDQETPGAVAEPDVTDVVMRVTNPQIGLTPVRTIDCKDAQGTALPETDDETNPDRGAGSKETYTCTVKFQNQGVPSVTVDAENMSGVNDTEEGTDPTQRDYTCTTDNSGTCTIAIPTNELTDGAEGFAQLCFWVDDDSDDIFGGTEVADGAACAERWDVVENASNPDILQVDVVRMEWEVPVATTLNIEPENLAKNPTTETAVFPMSLKDQFGNNLAGGDIDFKVLTGPNKKITATMDLECVTAADGTCSVTHTPNSFQFNGIDKVCAWLDADGNDAYAAAGLPTDGGGCATEAASPETDDGGLTDRGQVHWTGGNPAPTRLEAEPETQSATASTARTVNVILKDEQDTAMSGQNIDFEITGVADGDGNTPETPDASCTTGTDGKCVTPLSITGPAVGETQVRAWVDIDNDQNAIVDGEVDQTEGPNEVDAPGLVEEFDTTDVVIISWKASPTSVTMGYSAPTIVYGTQITLAGFLKAGTTGLPGKTVIVERRVGGDTAFRTLALANTDANGKWTWTGRPGSTAEYRASFSGEPPGLLPSRSPVLKVAVRVVFANLAASTRTPAPRTAVAFTGKVLPVHSGKRVYLQVLGPKESWRNVATTLCDGNGAFRMTYRRNVGGTLNFRILFPAQDLDHGGNLTSRFSIRWA